MLKPEKFDVEMTEHSDITWNECSTVYIVVAVWRQVLLLQYLPFKTAYTAALSNQAAQSKVLCCPV